MCFLVTCYDELFHLVAFSMKFYLGELIIKLFEFSVSESEKV